MILTPEEISQKSFSTRLRGVDSGEVRDFLKSVAAQCADLQDRITQQHRTIEEQEKELELGADDRKSFEDIIEVYKGNIEQLKSELEGLRAQNRQRTAECEQLQRKSDAAQQERVRLGKKLSDTETAVSELERTLLLSRATVEELRGVVVQLETDKRELSNKNERHAETLGQARRDADELVKNAEQRARQLIAEAKERIEEHRDRAVKEIVGLREDIERLKNQRSQLTEDLKNVLNAHMEQLDIKPAEEIESSPGAHDELFQKIDFTELVEFDLGDDSDPLLDDPLSEQSAGEDTEDRLRSTLEDGGISYLSDE